MKKILRNSATFLENANQIKDNELAFFIMNLPFSCNLKCLKCYRRQNVSMEDFELDVRKEKIREAQELGAKVFCIAGEGEPLLHWEILSELIDWAHYLGLGTLLYTNGSLLSEEKINFLFSHDVTVIISIDSLNQSTYCQLVDVCVDFEKIKINISMIRNIYKSDLKKQGGCTETRLGIITIATMPNMSEIEQIKEFCGEDIFFICNYPIQKGLAEKNWELIAGNEIEHLKQLAHQHTETGHGGLSAPLRDGRCIALYHGITIDTDGNALTCPASVDSVVGNIKDFSIRELWEKTRESVEKLSNPLCAGRNIVLKEHNGILMKQV
jgi:MoaA/NifB/PqqE/SkfB family radical SAM enzyme